MSNNSQVLIKQMTGNVLSAVQILGFDLDQAEKSSKLTLNGTTFSKPNSKAFEMLVHFLLTQIDAERSQKAFSQCWPPILKEQQKEFRDTMFTWLTEITSSKHQKENASLAKYFTMLGHIKFPNITKSLLMTPGGLKTCELLFSLTQYVMLLRLLKLSKTDFD